MDHLCFGIESTVQVVNSEGKTKALRMNEIRPGDNVVVDGGGTAKVICIVSMFLLFLLFLFKYHNDINDLKNIRKRQPF